MLRGCVVGALACQKDSYLRTIDAEVVSCAQVSKPSQDVHKTSSKKLSARNLPSSPPSQCASELWEVEFTDSVLFPEGGGQPTDHGTVVTLTGDPSNRISVSNVQRHGLRCVYHLSEPLSPGTKVRQEVEFDRRWNHMQQHTGQHLLSAIMDKYNDLATLGWGMGSGDNPNYVDLPRKPSEEEKQQIQNECNQAIRDNLAITVTHLDNAKVSSLPDDYDTNQGLVRVINIGDLDKNACCGTHLRQTSHIGLILLQYTQPVHSKQCRLFFSAGDRAIRLATTSIASVHSVASLLSSGSASSELLDSVSKIKQTVSNLKKREAKLVQTLAKHEADSARIAIQSGRDAWIYRPDEGLDFINMVMTEIKKDTESNKDTKVVAATGQENMAGQIIIVASDDCINGLVAKIKEAGIEAKGGGRGGRWQGKVIKWKKGELETLRKLVIP